MVDVVVNQRSLGVCDCLLDGVQLLRQFEALSLGLDHGDDAAQMAFDSFQAADDIRVSVVRGSVHFAILSPLIGYCKSILITGFRGIGKCALRLVYGSDRGVIQTDVEVS